MTKEPSTALWRALTSTPAQQLTIPSTDQSSVDSESPRPIDLTELAEDDATKGSETTISASLDEVDSKEYIRKRKRGEAYKLLNHGSTAEDDIDASPKKWARFDRRRPYQRRQRFVGLRLPELVYPKSQYVGWTPPLPRTFESVAVQDLMDESSRLRREELAAPQSHPAFIDLTDEPATPLPEFTSFDLDQFVIYKTNESAQTSNELVCLHHLCIKDVMHNYLFDGLISEGNVRRWVKRIPFRVVSIGNYCDPTSHGVGDQVWIQSIRGQKSETQFWYHLTNPAPEYRQYHSQFLWLANFAKYFTDFLQARQHVQLHHFRHTFGDYIQELHGHDPDFCTWMQTYGDTDFARVVAVHWEFLWKEAVDVDSSNRKHPLWLEIDHRNLRAVKAQPVIETQTIVTPFVYSCFKHMSWGKFLKPAKTKRKVLAARRQREQDLHLTVDSQVDVDMLVDSKKESQEPLSDIDDLNDSALKISAGRARVNFRGVNVARPTRLLRSEEGDLLAEKPCEIRVGDVVGVPKDALTVWKGNAELWYAYVQDSRMDSRARQQLRVIWLYHPADTTCSRMRYPFANELFFSDNCNCKDATLDAAEVVCKVSVALFHGPGETGAEFFIRQLYETGPASFVTLKHSHLLCAHLGPWKTEMDRLQEKYREGDTVLYTRRGLLEPGEIRKFTYDGAKERVIIRELRRRTRDYRSQPDSQAMPNELVYTDDLCSIAPERVLRRCHTRFYTLEQKESHEIPAPYSRQGTGDAYFITTRQSAVEGAALEALQPPFPPSLIEGFDPSAPPPKKILHGMDLYCGGGNFGRGIEEGGAVHNKWAVDYDEKALHTYHANLRDPSSTSLYFGSVNDLLSQALKGHQTPCIPAPGEVDFISAGSPCQGFSKMNSRKSSDSSQQNCSLVASVAAYVDFYRPRYALLENVVTMARAADNDGAQNVFSQSICCLVGMGYQVQQFNLDAWSFGSPQSRSRLFLSIAAPGLPLPPHPGLSHSHPDHTAERSLGTASNGVQFGTRRFDLTPFTYLTGSSATADLPYLGSGRSQTCIPHPDHRTSRVENRITRTQIAQIPVNPRDQSFFTASQGGFLAKPQIEGYSWENKFKSSVGSRAWKRVNPHGLLPTITTACQPSCSFTGTILHWDQHRLLTVMEARRAQSFPDNEIILGLPSTQWKIVGNSVARTVALALGISLREAWLGAKTTDADAVVRACPTIEDGLLGTDTRHQPARRESLQSTPERGHRLEPIDLSDDDESEDELARDQRGVSEMWEFKPPARHVTAGASDDYRRVGLLPPTCSDILEAAKHQHDQAERVQKPPVQTQDHTSVDRTKHTQEANVRAPLEGDQWVF